MTLQFFAKDFRFQKQIAEAKTKIYFLNQHNWCSYKIMNKKQIAEAKINIYFLNLHYNQHYWCLFIT